MGPRKRILLVDDDPDIHALLRAALESPDRDIDSAYDGLAGLRCVEAGVYDLVIADVNMPGMDGLALLEHIQKIRPGAKVVIMTLAGTPENIVHALRERAFTYIGKPFTLDAVSELVERALNSTPAEDDIQVLSARPQWLTLRLRCKIETADRLLPFLRDMGMDLPPSERDSIAMAFREILLNAIEHGAGNDPEKRVSVAYLRTGRALLYYVRDPGKGFSFQNLEHAAVSNPQGSPFEHAEIRERMGLRPGGFGLLMTRQLVDEMIYNEAGNEVLLIKYLH